MQNHPTPLNSDTLLMGFVHTGELFELVNIHSSVKVGDRTYSLIEGCMTDCMTDKTFPVYAVATPESVAGGWRIALLAQNGHSVGFNYLKGVVEVPTFAAPSTMSHSHAAIAIRCRENDVNLFVRQVLAPYQLPVKPEVLVGERIVDKVGTPLFFGDNQSAMVPVRFKEGAHGLVFCMQATVRLFISGNAEVMKLITNSSAMPVFRDGIGAGVWHITVEEEGEPVLIKCFNNQKAGRPAEIYR